MTRAPKALLAVLLSASAIAACQPTTVPANPPPPTVAAPAPPPAKMVTMICRNSQTGASVECGTPNAVMVGTKEQ